MKAIKVVKDIYKEIDKMDDLCDELKDALRLSKICHNKIISMIKYFAMRELKTIVDKYEVAVEFNNKDMMFMLDERTKEKGRECDLLFINEFNLTYYKNINEHLDEVLKEYRYSLN